MVDTAGLKCLENFDSGAASSLKCGGSLKRVYLPENVSQLCAVGALIRLENATYRIIGRLTNTLVMDEGYDGIVISTERLKGLDVQGDEIYAGSGEKLSSVVLAAKEHNLAGLERLTGVPGSVGGAVCMNSGCFGEEIANVVHIAYAFNFETQKTEELTHEELKYSYRSSALLDGKKLLVGVCLKMKEGNRYDMENAARMCRSERKIRQPSLPSLGSVFKRVEGLSAGVLIEGVGLKGKRLGGMEISKIHANFIVNNGGGTASEYIQLMELAERKVFDSYGIHLKREVRILGEGQE